MKYASIGYLFVGVLMTTPAAAEAGRHGGSQITRYCVTEIGDGTWSFDFISDMNERGHVVGLGSSGGAQEVLLWDRKHGFEVIDGLVAEEGFISGLLGINDRDQIVGTWPTGPDGSILRAFVWSRGKGVRFLQPPPGDEHSGAVAINNFGQVIGTSGPFPDEGVIGNGVIWDRRFGVTDLGSLPGGLGSNLPVDINDAGEVVGLSDTPEGIQAYIWDRNNGIRSLGSLPGGGGGVSASAINDRGEVVGTGGFGTGQHAYFWTENTGIVDLGDLPDGADLSGANDINNRGQIVGYGAEQGGSQAVLWDSNGAAHKLNDLIVREEPDDQFLRMFYGQEINDAGWIAAVGFDTRDTTFQQLRFLLTPARRGNHNQPCGR